MSDYATTSEIVRAARATIDLRSDAIVKLCGRLVDARSINPPGDTQAVARVVVDALSQLGVKSSVVSKIESMPCVVAEIGGSRPGPHLVLNVHLDTMPAGDETAWSFDPYRVTSFNGRLYGLGMGNMKGSVAAMVHAVSLLSQYREAWSGTVTFTAVSDEVVFGPHGAEHLLETFPQIVGDAMICGEGPGFARLAIAEKGVLWLELGATGTPGHSSSVSKMASATATLAAAVLRIDALNGRRASVPKDLKGLFTDSDPGFELTANVGTLNAGTFIGQVAAGGKAEIDFRVPPGMTITAIENDVRDLISDIPGLSVKRIKGWDPNWTAPHTELARAWHTAEDTLDWGKSTYAIRLPASDASRWRARGVPALCFGPQPGSSAGIDDYAEQSEVIRCAELYFATSLIFLRRDPGTPAE